MESASSSETSTPGRNTQAEMLELAKSGGTTKMLELMNSRMFDIITCEALCKVPNTLNNIVAHTSLGTRMRIILDDYKGSEPMLSLYGLTGTRWNLNSMRFAAEKYGTTLDRESKYEVEKTLKISDFEEYLYSGGTRIWSDLRVEKPNRLDEFPLESAIHVLCSYLHNETDDSLAANISYLERHYNLPKAAKRRMRNAGSVEEKVRILKEYLPIKGCKSIKTVAKLSVGELLECCADEMANRLEQRIANFSAIKSVVEAKQVMNAGFCQLWLSGTARINAIPATSKLIKFYVEHNGMCITAYMHLRCLSTTNSISEIEMNMQWEVNINQQRIIDVYARHFSSPGVFTASLDEIVAIQDEVWEVLIMNGMIEAMSDQDDMAIANAADLVPLMTLAGVAPSTLDMPIINDMWYACIRKLVDKLCGSTGCFGSIYCLDHFVSCLNTALCLGSDCSSDKEMSKLIVQFFLWGVASKTSDSAFLEGVNKEKWSQMRHREKVEYRIAGLGAQTIWLACELFENEDMSKIGYKYLADIMLFNLLSTGKCQVKILSLGFWLAGCFNSSTDTAEEDRLLIDRCSFLGLAMESLTVEKLISNRSLAGKIAVLIEAMSDRTLGKLYKQGMFYMLNDEACGVIVALKLANERTVTEAESEEVLKTVVGKITNKIETSVEDETMTIDIAESIISKMIGSDDVMAKATVCSASLDSKMDSTIAALVNEAVIMKQFRRDLSEEEKQLIINAKSAAANNAVLKMFSRQNVDRMSNIIKGMPKGSVAHSARDNKMSSDMSARIESTLSHSEKYKETYINLASTAMHESGFVGLSVNAAIGDAEIMTVSFVEASTARGLASDDVSKAVSINILGGIEITHSLQYRIDVTQIIDRLKRIIDNSSRSAEMVRTKVESNNNIAPEVRAIEFGRSETQISEEIVELQQIDTEDTMTENPINKTYIKEYCSTLKDELMDWFDTTMFTNSKRSRVCNIAVVIFNVAPASVGCLVVLARRIADLVWDTARMAAEMIARIEERIIGAMEKSDAGKMTYVYFLANKAAKIIIKPIMFSYRPSYEIMYVTSVAAINGVRGLVCYMIVRVDETVEELNAAAALAWSGAKVDVTATMLAKSRILNYQLDTKRKMISGERISLSRKLVNSALNVWYVVRATIMAPFRACNFLFKKLRTFRDNTIRMMRKTKEVTASVLRWTAARLKMRKKKNSNVTEKTSKHQESSDNDEDEAFFEYVENMVNAEVEKNRMKEKRRGVYAKVATAACERLDKFKKMAMSVFSDSSKTTYSVFATIACTTRRLARKIFLEFNQLKTGWLTKVKKILACAISLPARFAQFLNALIIRLTYLINRTREDDKVLHSKSCKTTGRSEDEDSDGNAGTNTAVPTGHDTPFYKVNFIKEVLAYIAYRCKYGRERKPNELNECIARKQKVGKAITEEIVEKILSEQKYCCERHAYLECWKYMGKHAEKLADKCGGYRSVNFELVGKGKIVQHNCMKSESRRFRTHDMNLIDCDGVTVLRLPSNERITIDYIKQRRQEDAKIIKLFENWSFDKSSSTMLSCPINRNTSVLGRNCVIEDMNSSENLLLTPAHVWRYGAGASNNDEVDQLMCLGMCSRESTMRGSPDEDAFLVSDEAEDGSKVIYCRRVIQSESSRYCFCIVDAVSWQGKSGLPIYDKDDRMVGICVMQIMVDGSPDIMEGAGVVVCCCDVTDQWPVFIAPDLKIISCSACDEWNRLVMRKKDELVSCNDDESDAEGDGEGSGFTSSLMQKLKGMLWHDDAKTNVEKTSALTDACKIISSQERSGKHKYLEGGDDATIHNIKEVLYMSNVVNLSKLSTAVLEEVLESYVLKNELWIVTTENGAMLSIAGLMASLRVRYTVVRTAIAFNVRSRSCGKNNVFINLCCWEDMMCWLLLESIATYTLADEQMKVAVVHPEGYKESMRAIDCCKLMLSCCNTIKTIIYSSLTTGLPETETEEGDLGALYYRQQMAPTMQSTGSLCLLRITSSETMSAEINEFSDETRNTRVSCCVLTMLSTNAELSWIKNRVCKTLNLDKAAIICVPVTAVSAEPNWRIVRHCSILVIHSGLSANCAASVIPNCMQTRLMTKMTMDVIKDTMKLISMAREDWEFASSFTCNINQCLEGLTRRESQSVLIRFKPNANSSLVEVTETALRKKVNNVIINGVCLVRETAAFEEEYASINAELGITKVKLDEVKLLTDEAIIIKRVQLSYWETLTSAMKKAAESIKWSIFNAAVSIEMRVVKMVEWLKAKIAIFSRKAKKSMEKMKKAARKYGLESLTRLKKKIQTVKTAKNENSLHGRLLSMITDGFGLMLLTANVKQVGRKKISNENRYSNGLCASMAWLVFNLLCRDVAEVGSNPVVWCGTTIGRMSTAISMVSYYMDKTWQIRIGNVVLGDNNYTMAKLLRLARLAATYIVVEEFGNSGTKGAVVSASREARNEASKTAMTIMECCSSDAVWQIVAMNVASILNDCCDILYRLRFRIDLGKMIDTLWEGITSRNESSKGAKGVVRAIHCVDSVKVTAGVLILGLSSSACYKIAANKSKRAAATIGVLADKKHAADLIELYVNDRSTHSTVARCITAAASLASILSTDGVVRIIGAGCAGLLLLDYLTEKESVLGMNYRMSNIITRVTWSRNKFLTAITSVLEWACPNDVVCCVGNVVVITADRKNQESWSGSWANETAKAMVDAQSRERRANLILTDLTGDPLACYNAARKIILGGKYSSSTEKLDKHRWALDKKAMVESVNLTNIARKGKMVDEDIDREVVVVMANIVKNQCRYLGRTLKVRWQESADETYMSEEQASVLFLDENLWEGVVEQEDRADWSAAGDSRYAVLLAIAERNDTETKFDVDETDLAKFPKFAIELVTMICECVGELKTAGRMMDWKCVIANTNEKSTSGIMARTRSGLAITAGYVAKNFSRIEVMKEIITGCAANHDAGIVNVFAKRRIEKEKMSNITGLKCTITRTIQGNECEMKLATIEAFILTDKVLKSIRGKSGIALGMNFFFEYSEDDLAVIVSSLKADSKDCRTVRIALDHSSFDGNQRNWSIELVKQIRIKIADKLIKSRASRINYKTYILNSYDLLMVRLMLTASGDMFAVTGQQMSGHATTSSDNSLRAWLYARFCAEELYSNIGAEMQKNSLRVQGDDTKLNMMVPDHISDDDLKDKISETMARIGQKVNANKIEITGQAEGCSFLSHKSKFVAFEVSNDFGAGIEICYVPSRERTDIFAMIGTTLKTQKGATSTKKTKKDVSLLAAKAMSYLIMYTGDIVIVKLCCSVIVGCFTVLSAMRSVSNKIDINSKWLPWLGVQGGLAGEFKIDLVGALERHCVNRRMHNMRATAWVTKLTSKDREMLARIDNLQENFRKVFKRIKHWHWERLNDAFQERTAQNLPECVKFSVTSINDMLAEITDELTLSIGASESKYKPYVTMKADIMRTIAAQDKIHDSCVGIVVNGDFTNQEKKLMMLMLESQTADIRNKADWVTEDMVGAVDQKAQIAVDQEGKIIGVLSHSEYILKAIGIKSWQMFEVIRLGDQMKSAKLMRLKARMKGTAMTEEMCFRRFSSDRSLKRFLNGEMDISMLSEIYSIRRKIVTKTNLQTLLFLE